MGKIYVHNDTAGPIFKGGKFIPPGEGREVDADELPPGDKPDPEAAAGAGEGESTSTERLAGNLADLLKSPIKEIVPVLADLSDESLAELAAAEEADQARKGLLSAITELQLQRAQAKAGAPT